MSEQPGSSRTSHPASSSGTGARRLFVPHSPFPPAANPAPAFGILTHRAFPTWPGPTAHFSTTTRSCLKRWQVPRCACCALSPQRPTTAAAARMAAAAAMEGAAVGMRQQAALAAAALVQISARRQSACWHSALHLPTDVTAPPNGRRVGGAPGALRGFGLWLLAGKCGAVRDRFTEACRPFPWPPRQTGRRVNVAPALMLPHGWCHQTGRRVAPGCCRCSADVRAACGASRRGAGAVHSPRPGQPGLGPHCGRMLPAPGRQRAPQLEYAI